MTSCDSQTVTEDTALAATPDRGQRMVSVLGVRITDVTKAVAIAILEQLIQAEDGRCRSVFLVNAHTLNVATDQPDYRNVLNSADYVFNDGTGVRWAARQRGIELQDNLCGTDLIPDFLAATAGKGYRYFLLGATEKTIADAAAVAHRQFPGWTLAGFHHGYVHAHGGDCVIDRINAAAADLLLIGMGNPIQERWIRQHQAELRVPLAIGVGGIFDHWVGKPKRAPAWVRRAGCEWMHKLLLQPHKWRRYLLGNPTFLCRMTRSLKDDLAKMGSEGVRKRRDAADAGPCGVDSAARDLMPRSNPSPGAMNA